MSILVGGSSVGEMFGRKLTVKRHGFPILVRAFIVVPNLLVFFGPPHSGKSTMARLLVDRRNFQSIDLGEILRKIVFFQPEHPRFTEIRRALTTGNLISDETTLEIVEGACDPVSRDGLIFDGFPRSTSAIEPFRLFLRRMAIPSQFVILCEFAINLGEIEHRVSHRGRADDLDQGALGNRLRNFRVKAMPALAILKRSYRHVLLPFSDGTETNYSRLVRIVDEQKQAV